MRALPTRKLDKRAVKVWRIEAAISTVVIDAIILVVAGLLYWFEAIGLLLAIALVAVGILIAILYIGVYPTFRYARWFFDVTPDEVDLMEGIIFRKRTIIPLVRVQSVDTSQGPILRMFDISTVSVATAAGSHVIPALSQEEADTLRDHISALARVAQEDV